MAQISRKEFNDAALSYAMSTVVVTPDAKDPSQFQWAIADTSGDTVIDDRSFKTESAAMNAAEYYVRNDSDMMSIGRNDAREWMKYNGHTFAKESA